MRRTRTDIVNAIGRKYLTANCENDEWLYPRALKSIGKSIAANKVCMRDGTGRHERLDLRFEDKDRHISVLVETKRDSESWNKEKIQCQLQAYVEYEKVLTGNKIVAIFANTDDERVQVWWGSDLKIDDAHKRTNQYELLPFDDYADLYLGTVNDKEQVLQATYELNIELHKKGIPEKLRSQFVGTCLLCLKNGLLYENLPTPMVIAGMLGILQNLLEDDRQRNEKLEVLRNILKKQQIEQLSSESFTYLLNFIYEKILPNINEKSTMGQDLLNLFFTTFNKYVGKADKNQAFTPDHIVHFMCRVLGVNRNSVVLDPCCGSGAFLVRAMTEALDDCATNAEREEVKSRHIYGIEKDRDVFGLASTNMLIHGDGRSNVQQGDMFCFADKIASWGIDTVLMNPPYNAVLRDCNPEYAGSRWIGKKEDPTQGLHFVHYIASRVKKGRLAVLLPLQCAIGAKKGGEITTFKRKMLEDHTLDAVFTLPPDIFHPGANANVCCMVFNLGVRHTNSPIRETFFGYCKDDGFIKRKNLGRVERTKPNSEEGVWADIESEWLELYNKRSSVSGKSVTHRVGPEDEWLAEAYMETDYSTLSEDDFMQSIRDLLAYKLANHKAGSSVQQNAQQVVPCRVEDLPAARSYTLDELFDIILPNGDIKEKDCEPGDIPLVSSGSTNNGVVCWTNGECDSPSELNPGGCITLDMFGQPFYQPDAFYCVSHGRVNILRPKKHLTENQLLYVCTIMRREQYRFSYGRALYSGVAKKLIVKLPATADGVPDWLGIERYMQAARYKIMELFRGLIV